MFHAPWPNPYLGIVDPTCALHTWELFGRHNPDTPFLIHHCNAEGKCESKMRISPRRAEQSAYSRSSQRDLLSRLDSWRATILPFRR
jgi:hypothetical protein